MVTAVDRMRHAVAAHAAVQPASIARPPSDGLPPIDRILRGDWHETAHGPVFVRDEWHPVDHLHGVLPLSAPLSACPRALAALLAAGEAPRPERLAFFDIETTGLSGGTGTYVILAGLGSFEDGAFRMRQYFLADIASERAMLAMLAADLARFEGIVTYNGRAFDVPFVETRLTLARVPSPCGGLAHFDLLHAVRRLYKHRMPGCKLAEVERKLLRINRPDDVPGAIIPALYFDYVRAGRAGPLRGVFRHNADDVLSLVGILARLARLLDSAAELDPDDAIAVARWWELAREPARAAPLYEYALPWLEGGDDWAWAAARYAAICKRAGRRELSLPVWQALWRAGDLGAGLELAKHYEHHARDLVTAQETILELLRECDAADANGLQHRLARIRRKASRALARGQRS